MGEIEKHSGFLCEPCHEAGETECAYKNEAAIAEHMALAHTVSSSEVFECLECSSIYADEAIAEECCSW